MTFVIIVAASAGRVQVWRQASSDPRIRLAPCPARLIPRRGLYHEIITLRWRKKTGIC